jgi:hypothetical protein
MKFADDSAPRVGNCPGQWEDTGCVVTESKTADAGVARMPVPALSRAVPRRRAAACAH